ncbi:hypothetical protein F5B22DRAFT_3364 [Xylaria bambusicola]|uniref:uncharacterized protein n=1 Tax=Xylaria bambusicola TaxID=326684 RepID=UPI002008A266|nr:uncharacterized protein F5B22DRAFT_3364 [Xylaria bambusicola]KAI0527772.1 hypothetical protein F5B22DRAFT_3364 [Xylaria bambusicola]
MEETSDASSQAGKVPDAPADMSAASSQGPHSHSDTNNVADSSHVRDADSDEDIPNKEERQLKSRLHTIPSSKDDPDQANFKAEAASLNAFPNLEKAVISENVEVLCCHKAAGLRVLEELAQCLSSDAEYCDHTRLSSVEALKKRGNTSKTVIGVVGGTGHGKSSLINALLEENKLVPTNCYRACTAVVTELSWNFSDNPDHRYIAEVEFVSADDWGLELQYLYDDLLSVGGSSDEQLKDSDAQIAWAKIKAVYPTLNRQALGHTSLDALTNNSAVKDLLGTTKTVRKQTAAELTEAIQVYVGSGKKMTVAPSSQKKDSVQKMEVWPLVKVVRIYIKADALSTGAVIVDLPGTKDSNAGRASVAGKYIEKCNALWVVSMITRAVDDQAAHELLGERFKQQLKLDGNYSNVTFICSKTDDINFDEAADSFGLDEEMQQWNDLKQKLSQLKLSSNIQKHRMRKKNLAAFVEQIDDHLELYEDLRSDQANRKTVTPPKKFTRKRVRTDTEEPNKRRKLDSEELQDTRWVSIEDLWEDMEKNMPKFAAGQLTHQDIKSMTEYLHSKRSAATTERRNLQRMIVDDEARIGKLEDEVLELRKQIEVACVSTRNNFSREAIREQFASGLKELDELEAQTIDPNNFDPEQEKRDYAEVGRSLPVYCVSSSGYQSLTGNEQVKGFCDVGDTQIPQLREFTKKSTESTRIYDAKSFLNDLAQALNSLYLWSSRNGAELYLTGEEKETEMRYVTEQVEKLGKCLEEANEQFFKQLKDMLQVLFQYFKDAAVQAHKRSRKIARSWPSQKRGDKGLSCATYKATVRRNGVFSGKSGPRNFNEDLAAPLLQHLGNQWDITFTKKIPEALVAHTKACQRLQDEYHDLIKSRIQKNPAFHGVANMLKDQDKKRVIGLANKINSFTSDITTIQREANRAFTPAIQQKLKSKYKELCEDKGPGVFARIRAGMEEVVGKKAVFSSSYKSPHAKLSEIPENIREELQIYVDIMSAEMKEDYGNLILGASTSQESKVVRQKVHELLKDVDSRFQ